MNWLDIVFICLAGIGFVKGLFDGVIKQVVSLIALVVGIYFCGKAAFWLNSYLITLGWFPVEVIPVLSYVIGFILIVGLVMGAGNIVHRLIGVTPLSLLNHMAGGLFGIILTLLFCSLLLNILELTDRNSALISYETKVESRFYFQVKELLPSVYPVQLFHTVD